MNSRERVLKTFCRDTVDRVPCWFGASEEFLEKIKRHLGMSEEEVRIFLRDDFRVVRGGWKKASRESGWVAPFQLERYGVGCGYTVSHPLAEVESIAEVEKYPFADPAAFDAVAVLEEAKKYSDFAVMSGAWAPFWHDAIDLVGHENLYYLFYDYPEVAQALFNRITDFYLAVNEKILAAAAEHIDIIFIGNDFGAQAGPLLGVEHFREFIAPSLKRLCQQAEEYHIPVMLHSCGAVCELLPAIIECGIAGMHALQPDAHGMDYRKIKDEFGGDLILNGAIDSVNILINTKNTVEVKEKTKEVVEYMMQSGGYIGAASHDTILEETPVENVIAMFEAIYEYGCY